MYHARYGAMPMRLCQNTQDSRPSCISSYVSSIMSISWALGSAFVTWSMCIRWVSAKNDTQVKETTNLGGLIKFCSTRLCFSTHGCLGSPCETGAKTWKPLTRHCQGPLNLPQTGQGDPASSNLPRVEANTNTKTVVTLSTAYQL